jgi:hypothetical protein
VAPELGSWAGIEITPAMDVYSIGATLRRALDPAQDPAGRVSEVIGGLADPDPARRPTPDAALASFVRLAGPRASRPWPAWADRHLARASARHRADPVVPRRESLLGG